MRPDAGIHKSHSYLIIFSLFFLFGCHTDKKKTDLSESAVFKSIIDLANQKVAEGRWEEAKIMLDSSFHALQPLSVADSYAYYSFYAEINNKLYKNYRQAFLYTDTLKRLLENNNATKVLSSEYALVFYARGDIYFHAGNFREAYEEFYKGREIGKESLDACALSDYNYRLGMILYKQDRYFESLVQFKKCREELVSCADKMLYRYRIQEVIGNIGLCYYNLRSYDSAAHAYSQMLSYIDNQLKPETLHEARLQKAARAVAIGNLAAVYDKKGETAKSMRLYRESIQVNLENQSELHDVMRTNLKLAKLYYNSRRTAEMMKLLDDERKMLDTLPDIEVEMKWNRLMSQYFEGRDPSRALRHMARYDQLRDSEILLNKALRESDIKESLNNLEKEQKISVLEKSYSKNERFLSIAIFVAIFSVTVVLFIGFYMRRQQKYLKVMAALNSRITEQKIQLEVAMSRIEASHKDKDRIMNVVAHDLRSPVAAIYSLADLMLMDEQITGEQKETLELIKTAANNSLTLSKEILDTALLKQSGKLHTEEMNFTDLLSGNIELLRFRAAEKKQTIDLSLPEEQLLIRLDKDKFSRVINNIVINAIKFSPEKSTISVKLVKSDRGVLMSVQDEGIGIPEKIKDRVFDMFTEAKREGTNGEKPYGLGLSIARQIIEAHGGTIWLETEEGKGTTFFIVLPYSTSSKS